MSHLKEDFYTARGYAQLLGEDALTPSMEDYLEMIFRLSSGEGYTRVNDIASALNIQPPSVTRMLKKLGDKDLVLYEKYGIVRLTDKGDKVGGYLLNRHNTLKEFLELIGVTENIHEDVEGIEHNVSKTTMECIISFVKFFKEDPAWLEAFSTFKKGWP